MESFSITSGGMIRAASASPERTLSSASRREWTVTGSTDLNSWLEYLEASILVPPTWNLLALGGTSLRNATLGFSGPRESAKPSSSATTIG